MSQDNFGLKIGVEGEKAFKQSLADINQTFKVLGSEMQLVTSQFDRNDKSAAALTSRNNVLNKEIDAQKEKISTLRAALENAASSFGESDKRTQNWQIALNKAEAELNGMERELGENEKALEGVGDEMKDTAKDSDKLGTEVEKTGKDADESGKKFEKLGGVLKGVGVAIGAAMAAIGTAAVAAGKKMYDMATDAAEAGDRVDKASQKLGLSAKAYQEWDYVLSQNGASIDSLGAGMKTLQKTMAGLTEDGDKSSDAFKKIGINFDEIKNKSPEEAFDLTVKALQNMPPGAEKTAAAMKLLGKQGMELMPLLNQTAEETDGLKQRANALGMVMSEEAVSASVKFTDSLDTLKRTFAGVKNAIGAELLPGLTQITDGLADLIAGNDGAAESIKAGAQQVIGSISEILPRVLGVFLTIVETIAEIAPDIIFTLIEGITGNLPTLIQSAAKIIKALLEGIIQALPSLAAGAVELVLALVQGILDNLPSLLEAAIQVIVTLVQGISDALPQLIPAIVQAVITMVQALIDNLPMILDAALQLVLGLVEGILAALPELIAALPAIILAIVDFIIGAIPQIIEAGIQLLTSLIDALPEIIKSIVEAIPQIIDGIITAVIDAIPLLIEAGIKLIVSLIQALPQIITTIVAAIPKIISGLVDAIIGNIDKIIMAGVQLFVSLIQNLPTIIIEIVKAVPQIVTGLIDAFMGLLGKFADIGKNIITGIWDGIKNMGSWLWDKFKGFIKSTLGWVADLLGISSPSKVFRDYIGKNMMLGLAEGVDKNADEVYDSVRDVAKELAKTDLGLSSDLDVNAGIHYALDGAGAAVSLADLGYKLDGIAGLMAQMFPALLEALNVKVVLDDGTLVGRLAPEIDRNLALLRKRGLAY